MNQDTITKITFFGCLYAITFFLVYLSGRKVAPSQAIWLSVGCWVGLMLVLMIFGGMFSGLLFIPIVIASLFVFRHKADNSLQEFFNANRIYKASTAPEQVAKLLGPIYYSCAEGTLTTQSGKDVCYNWWQGMTSSMTKSGNAYVTTYTYYLAISFMPTTVTEAFKQVARAKMDTSGFTFRQKFKRFFVLDTDTPIRVVETEDGSFVIVWQTYNTAERYASYMNWLTANLQSNLPVEQGSVPIDKVDTPVVSDKVPAKNDNLPVEIDSVPMSESVIQPTLQSGRQLHEQALGRAPKLTSYSRF